jgi:2-C-methyl-D-erythritol 2,4-cyclodiphosphate synthase
MNNIRIGTGFDVHRLSEGQKLILGGVEIPHTRGCVGHSDADVLIHAICDAMLGALTLGDIGQHFPDNSDEFKGIDSRILLKKVNALISEEGYQIGNIDSTAVLQKPKIKDYIPKIREELASVLQVDVSQISVKVTTTEKLGFEGREEGVSAQAVCLLLRT